MAVGSRAGVLVASGHQLRTTMVDAHGDAATMTFACGGSEARFSPRRMSTKCHVG
jgi:hypothetical protein